ncbi:hypothetical protein GFY24_36110 [Nocardia sp. SYP-A9097]|uniref:pentapeptide repeat-containing protein n=1 Tax=Nocardia sp. SYP-A9097 TaxID=2663237 RepID=UPI00129B01D0|nr:pentapeptide repeat-containing protein [Nocardia sp. SYP-A9097]MRH92783.1 hypothetical protein [Nocardia sp. SYP-A9097]
MAGVADESAGLRCQQCINVLCGYLRLPYDGEQGSSGRTKLVLTTPTDSENTDKGKREEHIEYRQNDREVRQTIVRVITDHLRREAEYSWSTSDFDFRTAHLEDADFRAVRFSGAALFEGATFSGLTGLTGLTGFGGVRFSGNANFVAATFAATTSFGLAAFSGPARFTYATFADRAAFDGVRFSGSTDFGKTTFSGPTGFDRAIFSGRTAFDDATFSGTTMFTGAVFSGPTGFGGHPGREM